MAEPEDVFLPDLTEFWRERLRLAKIPIRDANFDTQYGTMLRLCDWPAAAAVLGAEVMEEKKMEQPQNCTWKKIQHTKAPAGLVLVESWHSAAGKAHASQPFEAVAREILLPAVGGRDVVLHVPHGRKQQPIEDGRFHLFVWSAPGDSGVRHGEFACSPEFFGFNVDNTDCGFRPSGKGVVIYDDDGESPIGELVGSSAYIFHDAVHLCSRSEVEIFRRFCREVAAELLLEPEKMALHRKELMDHADRRTAARFVDECSAGLISIVEATKADIVAVEDEIRQIRAKLRSACMKEIGLRRKLEQVTLSCEEDKARFPLDFTALRTHPKVDYLRIKKGELYVYTRLLYCWNTDSQTLHEIGKMRFRILINSVELRRPNQCLRIDNLTRNIVGYKNERQAHPHVYSTGIPCLNESSAYFDELLAARDFLGVLELLIQFVETCTATDPAGRYIDRWPVVPRANYAAISKAGFMPSSGPR